ncbi:MAG: hypothetical protein ACRD2X_04700 [Vicinamibacteraceae bacterium]
MMGLRVAFDLDGTLADLNAAIARIARGLFGPAALPPASDNGDGPHHAAVPPPLAALTARQQAALWAHIEGTEDFWTSLAETVPGIVARIATAARERRWEVIFITTRPSTAGDTTQRQTQRWLEAHGFACPSVFVVNGSRGKVAEALTLDAVVDDHLEKAVDVAVESHAKSLLIWDGDTRDVPPGALRLGMTVVDSIGEALSTLVRLDDLKREPGMLRSITRMLTRRA